VSAPARDRSATSLHDRIDRLDWSATRAELDEVATQRLMEAIEELAAEVGKVPGPWDVEQEESQVTS